MRIVAGVWVAMAAFAGCGGATDVRPRVDSTVGGAICGLGVTPASVNLSVGDIVTFSVSSCVTGGVFWRSSAPAVAIIDSLTGTMRAVALGTTSVVARSRVDPTVQGAALVTVGSTSAGPQSFLDIQTVNEVGPPSTPANLGAVTGTIDVALSGGSTIAIRELRLIANDGARDITVAIDTTRIPALQSVKTHLFWNTAARNPDGSRTFANGGYRVAAAAFDSTGGRIATTASFQLTVVNP
jgi:hypothetical protein